MNSSDFSKGADFTGINPITGADFNNLVDLATPYVDSLGVEQKGINLFSKDSALNVPRVPNAAVTTKWKYGYIWNRKPFNTDNVISYVWNDDAVSDATLLKWTTISVDSTALEADIAAVQADADAALLAANNSTAVGNNAALVAAAASTTATAASVNAANALATGNAAQTTANTANNNANTALTAVDRSSRYMKFTETAVQGTDGTLFGLSVPATDKTRLLNTSNNNAGGYVSLAANQLTFVTAGTYRIRAWASIYCDAPTNAMGHILYLNSVSGTLGAATKYLTGSAEVIASGVKMNSKSVVEGIITVAAADVISLVTRLSGTPVNSVYQGKATNLGVEVYGCIELEKLS